MPRRPDAPGGAGAGRRAASPSRWRPGRPATGRCAYCSSAGWMRRRGSTGWRRCSPRRAGRMSPGAWWGGRGWAAGAGRVGGRGVRGAGARPLLAVEPPVQDPAGLDALYAWADLLVLPSRFEGVPLVILEAQRMGCAVAATDVGAVAEIVTDGADGVLVPAGLPEEAI